MALKISLKFVPKVRINNIPSLIQIMAWRRPGDKPLSEPMMVRLPTHICVTRPHWVNSIVLYCHAQYINYILGRSITSRHSDSAGGWNASLTKKSTRLSCMFDAMVSSNGIGLVHPHYTCFSTRISLPETWMIGRHILLGTLRNKGSISCNTLYNTLCYTYTLYHHMRNMKQTQSHP